ncbi:MAG TPA: NlpC/P60 family protein [Rubricoccaceae bacterium]|nr:NlpC/P60 family protein [Rubricoccaceae bacterium]
MLPATNDLSARPFAPALVAALATSLVLSGCATTGVNTGSHGGWVIATARAQSAPEADRSATAAPAPRRARATAADAARDARLAHTLRRAAEDWTGTPYRFGGTSRSGIDCSAFTQRVFNEALGIELPRNTALQVERGHAVSRDELRPGDLVFFRRRGTRHVGVYLGDDEFAHASTSRGVIVSRLDEDYYARHYWTARRVLDGAEEIPEGGLSLVRPTAAAEPRGDSATARRSASPPVRIEPARPDGVRPGGRRSDPRNGW